MPTLRAAGARSQFPEQLDDLPFDQVAHEGEFLGRHASPPSIVRAEIDQLVGRWTMAGPFRLARDGDDSHKFSSECGDKPPLRAQP